MSLAAVTAAGSAATSAPLPATALHLSGERFHTVSG